MKKAYSVLLSASLCFTAPLAHAQNNVAKLIKSGTENANILARAYSAPLSKAFGTDLNSGWLTTGKAFKTGRFEVRLFGNAAFVPQEDRTFDVSALGLSSNVRVAPGSSTIAQTVFGSKQDGPLVKIYDTHPDTQQEEVIASFNMPEGVGTSVAPVPMAQLNVGLLKETELMVRFLPQSTFGDLNVNMWGIGLKHGLRQWIPVISVLPFDITAAAAYSSFKSDYVLSIQPEEDVSNPNPADYTTQKLVFNTKAFTAMLVASKTFAILTGYAGLNYSSAETTTGALGNYPLTVFKEQSSNTKEIENVTDPIKFDESYQQVGLTGGFRLKLAFFSLNAEGTLAKYPTVSGGIGLGFN